MKILIYGSCVTNDIFSFVPHNHKLAGYVPRMSMGTAFDNPAPEWIIHEVKHNIENCSYRYWVLNDLEKRLEKILKSTAYDIILLDFIEERNNIACVDNSYFTISDEFKKAKIDESRFRIIKQYSEEHMDLVITGIKKFSSIVSAENVYVNKVFWSNESNDGTHFDENRINRNNSFLVNIYDHIDEYYDFNFIEYNNNVFVSDFLHKWGKSPYHYIEEYYSSAMDHINNLIK